MGVWVWVQLGVRPGLDAERGSRRPCDTESKEGMRMHMPMVSSRRTQRTGAGAREETHRALLCPSP